MSYAQMLCTVFEKRNTPFFFSCTFSCTLRRGYIDWLFWQRGGIRTVGLPRSMTGLDNNSGFSVETDFIFLFMTIDTVACLISRTKIDSEPPT